MSTIHKFEEMEAWQTARHLTKVVYELTAAGDFSRDVGLKDQMRRAAVSVMSNIAEGFESRTNGLFVELLGRAKGSSGELRAQFYIAHDAGYLTPAQFQALQDQCEKCSSQISRLMTYLKSLPNHKRSSEVSGPKRSNVPTFKRPSDAEVSGPKRPNVPTFKRPSDAEVSGPKRSNVPTFKRPSDAEVSGPKRPNVPTFKRPSDA